MGLLQNLLASIFPQYRDRRKLAMLRDEVPVFSQFGEDIYISDIVKGCLKAIAAESSKVTLKSVTEDLEPRRIQVENDSITRLFRYKPNPLMTTQEFFYRVAWLRKVNLNAFVYPKYRIQGGRKEFTGFYPLNPTEAGFTEIAGRMYITFWFENGSEYTLPYDEIIHLRDEFSENDMMGGNRAGEPDNREVLKTVSILDEVKQGLPKAIKASLQMRGLYTASSQIEAERLTKEREAFEQQLSNSSSGIAAVGIGGTFTPFSITPAMVPKETLDWLESSVLKKYGVSAAILSGTFTEAEYSSFYQRCVEDFIIDAHQAFSACCFTEAERAKGRQIKLYDRYVQHLSMETKFKMLQFAAPMGTFGRDEVRELVGYEPMGDNTVMQSLNWIDATLASQYQLSGKSAPQPGAMTAGETQEIVAGAEREVGEKLNGAQIASLVSVVQSVAVGTISRESALAILVSSLGISRENADSILGKASEGKVEGTNGQN